MEEKKNQALNDAVENEENVAVAAQSAPASDDLCLTDEEKGKLLVVRHLKNIFRLNGLFGRPLTYVRAVDDVSFTVDAGKTIGIVGESGCGKTTMGRTILRLHSVTDGQVILTEKT